MPYMTDKIDARWNIYYHSFAKVALESVECGLWSIIWRQSVKGDQSLHGNTGFVPVFTIISKDDSTVRYTVFAYESCFGIIFQ